jgi:hypothetical protein
MNLHTTGSWVRMLITLCMLAFSVLPGRADERLTARNKAVVREFYTTVLIGRDVDAAPRFLRPDEVRAGISAVAEGGNPELRWLIVPDETGLASPTT